MKFRIKIMDKRLGQGRSCSESLSQARLPLILSELGNGGLALRTPTSIPPTGPTGISEGVVYAAGAGKNYDCPGWTELGATLAIDGRMVRGRSPLKPHLVRMGGKGGELSIYYTKPQSLTKGAPNETPNNIRLDTNDSRRAARSHRRPY